MKKFLHFVEPKRGFLLVLRSVTAIHIFSNTCNRFAGTFGNPVALLGNYYKLVSSPGWAVYQYHVDFDPPPDSRRLRKGLLGNHGDKLFSIYLFDGMQLFSPTKLPDEV